MAEDTADRVVIPHATGSHEHSALLVDEHGCLGTFTRLPSLYPWPEEQL
ncbi:hypothetical protein [Sinomonas sp. RB5]